MHDYVYGHDRLVADFVAALIPELHGRSLAQASKAFGVVKPDGELIAGIVWHNWDPFAETIEMSGAALPGSRWVTPETLRHMYQYPYLQLGCQMTYMRVSERNERLLRQVAALGYSFYRLPRMLGRDHAMVLCQLTREAWEENKICARYRHHLAPMPVMEAA